MTATAVETPLIEQTAFAPLHAAGRLLNQVVMEEGTVPGQFVFRGEFGVEFAEAKDDVNRPPTILAQQVMATARKGEPGLAFFAGYLLNFAWLKPLADSLAGSLVPEGKYFAFCNNIALDERYKVELDGITWHVLPLDESSVYIELLELVDLERGDLKKLSSPGKVERIAKELARWKGKAETITYERGLELMGPVRDPGEHRPV